VSVLAHPSAALSLWPMPVHGQGVAPQGASFLGALEHWWREERCELTPDAAALAFTGGWALFFSYELAQEIEPHLKLPRTPLPWQAFALRTRGALIHELDTGRVMAVAESAAGARADRRRCTHHRRGLEARHARISAVREEDPQAYLSVCAGPRNACAPGTSTR
jgi:anthranilate synthase component 1